MRFFSPLSIASLVAVVSSTAIPLEKRAEVPRVLDVKLISTGNTLLKAMITNTGSRDLNLFNKGTFLDTGAVEKVTVSTDGKFLELFSQSKRSYKIPSNPVIKSATITFLPLLLYLLYLLYLQFCSHSTPSFLALFSLAMPLELRPCPLPLAVCKDELVIDVTILFL
jgi:amino acid transporter